MFQMIEITPINRESMHVLSFKQNDPPLLAFTNSKWNPCGSKKNLQTLPFEVLIQKRQLDLFLKFWEKFKF